MGLQLVALALSLVCCVNAQYYGNYHCTNGRDVVVHLFEWKWTSIAQECSWLAQAGYCAVQVSPPSENRIVTNPSYPWWQRYQPVSYQLTSRSGTRSQFISMVQTCNNAGVRIYVDAVINHMTGGGSGTGSGGNAYNGDSETYPAVPYAYDDFHHSDVCPTGSLEIEDYNNAQQVRYCRLSGLRDLRHGSTSVRQKIAAYLNDLIAIGVAGFRVDASKHMLPADMHAIFNMLSNLNTQWFPSGTRPFIAMEVIDLGGEAVSASEYFYIGRVTEFKYGKNLGDVIRKNNGQRLAYLRNFGTGWGFMNGVDAFTFVDNHDNQRGHGAGGFGSILTFFESSMYRMALAYMLAWNYGYPRVMSSYYWPRNIVDGKDQNDWVGPPSDSSGNTNNVQCFNGDWICEHRWRQVANMVKFHNTAVGQNVANWWDNTFHAIAFGRGNRAFIVINNENSQLDVTLTTGLPAGAYCDVISCDSNRPSGGNCGNSGGNCRGQITVNSSGQARFVIPVATDPNNQDQMIAIHV